MHETASAIIVSRDGTQVVLHRHKWSGQWLQPGGHLDAGETPPEAALREATEETGIAGLTHFGGRPTRVGGSVHRSPERLKPPHQHGDSVWLLVAPEGAQPAPPPGESPYCTFLHWDEALRRAADEPLREALRAARSRLHPQT